MPLISHEARAKPSLESNRRSMLRGPGGLLSQLEYPRPQVRRWAVRDLSHFAEAVRPLLACLHRENDAGVRESIFTALMVLGGEKVARGMGVLLKSDDAGLRNGAMEVLLEMPDHALLVIPELLKDRDPLMRLYGVELVRHLHPPRAGEWLSPMLTREDDDNVCAALAMCVGELGLHALVNELRHMARTSPFVSHAVTRALQRFSSGKG